MRKFAGPLVLFIAALFSNPAPILAQCGVERWSVKTGTDADVGLINLSSSTAQTIATMRSWPAPNPIPANNRVSPYETTQWVLNATLTQYKLESDSDYHLVLQDASGNTMIAEIPSPSCVGAGSPFGPGITNARNEFDARYNATSSFQTANIPVQIKGVGMFDFLHGQTGVAPNGIEIHAVLDIIFNPSGSGFSVSSSPSSVTAVQGTSATSTISTSISGSFNSAISLSASGLPTGATAAFSPTSIAAPGSGSSTLTLATSTSTPVGAYTVTVTASGGSITHTTTVTLNVTASGGGGALTNGGFETGNLSGWTSAGVTSASSAAKHSGSWGAQVGSTSPGGDSSIAQTFTLPAGTTSLSFWYANTCNDTITYDWATATVKDNVTNTTTTVLAKTCTATPAWTQVTWNAAASAGHSVTLTLSNHDDNNAGDPTFTYYDDVTVAAGGGDTTAPTTSVTAPANGATVSGTTNVTATASDNVGVTKMEIYIDGALRTSNTNATSLTYSWNTTTFANGSHSIVSKAYDAAGNVGTSSTITVTVSNSGSVQQLLGNPGFETGTASPWVASTGVVTNSTSEAAHGGTWKAWLDGYGSAHTDTLYQQVAIPSTITTATLTFWLHIDTAETTTTTQYDKLTLTIRNSSGTVLATLATYSNLNANTGYAQKTFDLSAYKGQTVQIYLTGVEDSVSQTSFVVDDFALNVQ
jgi:hypothetical protein